jgi:MoaA/NifB/PqqE/SkfB family radical SAM enzyme
VKIVENIKKIGLRELSNLIFTSPKARRLLLPVADKKIKATFIEMMNNPYEVPAEVEGQYWFVKNLLMQGSERIDENLLSPDIMKTTFNSLVDNVLFKGTAIKDKVYAEGGVERPTLLLISPTKRCNLHCTGCYAGSNKKTAASLDWDTFDRILTEKEELWDSYFTPISGGEPFMWRDGDRTIYDMFAKHKNQYFMVYTNGTFLNKENVRKLADAGNVAPVLSVEGFEKETDARRGKGVYDKVLQAFANLREAGNPFGISVTPTRKNADLVMSDEFVDFYFEKQKALFGWAFQYMPIGRDIDFDIMVTPEQRLSMYKKSKRILKEKGYSYVDFWNNGYLSNGCIAAGRKGGYFYINWDGNIAPCVFVPYYTANIYEIYKNGGDLNTARDCEFLNDVRNWQKNYGYMQHRDKVGNRLMPCPIRDHHNEMLNILRKNNVKALDPFAEEALKSDLYHEQLIEYDKKLAHVFDPVWECDFVNHKIAEKAVNKAA